MDEKDQPFILQQTQTAVPIQLTPIAVGISSPNPLVNTNNNNNYQTQQFNQQTDAYKQQSSNQQQYIQQPYKQPINQQQRQQPPPPQYLQQPYPQQGYPLQPINQQQYPLQNINNPYMPQYQMPPPPPPNVYQQMPQQIVVGQSPMVVMQQNSFQVCPSCGFTGSIPRRTAGAPVWAWCICLFCFTGILFWIPFCIDRCYDLQIICTRCGYVKSSVPGSCC